MHLLVSIPQHNKSLRSENQCPIPCLCLQWEEIVSDLCTSFLRMHKGRCQHHLHIIFSSVRFLSCITLGIETVFMLMFSYDCKNPVCKKSNHPFYCVCSQTHKLAISWDSICVLLSPIFLGVGCDV